MADIDDKSSPNAPAGDSGAAAVNIALGPDAAKGVLDPRAAAYLEEQTRLAKLQSSLVELQNQNLVEQNAFELSHLRWRRFNDQMKGALQIMIVLLGALVVVAIAAAMWNASQTDGLVVEAFGVPPAFAQQGIGGDVVADDLTNKVATIRDVANGNSIDVSKGVRKEGAEDIKVDIPDTGVSLTQAWRYLRAWLGHERRVDGNLRDLDNGRVALTVALEGADAFTLTGSRGDLDKLEQQAAEKLFADIDPLNYTLYLEGVARHADAYAQAARATQLVSIPAERADAYSLWSSETRLVAGDPYLAMRRARVAIALDPKILAPRRELMRANITLGHDEDALAAARLFHNYRREDQPATQQGEGFDFLNDEGEQELDEATGDFARGLSTPCKVCSWADLMLLRAGYAAHLHDVQASRHDLDAAIAFDPHEEALAGLTRFYLDTETGDWRGAATAVRSYETYLLAYKGVASAGYKSLRLRTALEPLLALALAQQGDFEGARAKIVQTPLDCILCLTMRGVIEARARNYATAAGWFARVDAAAPSIPFADTEWGRMLLGRGDAAGAIARFESAHAKGPHFADPLEMWGEALILKNHSDLAVVEFEDAGKYAPNWGRLHLKWGEALSYLGRKDEAAAQFEVATRLYLSPADRATLEKQRRTQGKD